jgi:hypothetical protein
LAGAGTAGVAGVGPGLRGGGSGVNGLCVEVIVAVVIVVVVVCLVFRERKSRLWLWLWL